MEPAGFFAELAADWRGRAGKRHWRTLGVEMEIQEREGRLMRVPAGDVPGRGTVAAAAGPGGGPISYSVEPDVVECSRPGAPRRTVTLMVHAENVSGAPVVLGRVSLAITLGAGRPALTVDPATIRPVPGRTTPWHVGVSGEGRWDCVPLPPTTGLGLRERASFGLSRVVVNEVPGPTFLRVEEYRGQERREVDLLITKQST